ncbi:MAG: ABC transporter ATP-binding protein [Clostridia bacterium]|nr:ABC transporter ATP-binding protein [Clostridia bacterium]
MPILETENIIKQYRQYDHTVTAVDRASIKVEAGEFIAIIGASGSGKSTFLNICAGLDRPDSGSVRIRGNEITKMKPDELGRFRGTFIGFVFQKHNLIPQFTALENIMLPTVMLNKDAYHFEEHFKKLVKALDIEDRLDYLPSELSSGQAQRVALARAMINRPQVLFADEPTGSLDRANADEVLELLLSMRELTGQTIVMVTHDLLIAERADKIYRMSDGKLSLYKDENGYRRNSYSDALETAKELQN